MTTKEHIENGQKAPIIRQSVFNKLMEAVECETGNDLDIVGLGTRIFGYSIGFYGEQDNGHELIIDEFGHFVEGDWVTCNPTPKQLETMKSMLSKEIKRIQSEIEQEELDEAYALQCEADEMRLGHPGAIYGKWY